MPPKLTTRSYAMTPYEPDLFYVLFVHPPGSLADVAAHVALALVCGLPVVGFFAATAPWWRGEA
jgi:hypothetical protein